MRLLSTALVGPSISVPVLVLLSPYHARANPDRNFPPFTIRVRVTETRSADFPDHVSTYYSSKPFRRSSFTANALVCDTYNIPNDVRLTTGSPIPTACEAVPTLTSLKAAMF